MGNEMYELGMLGTCSEPQYHVPAIPRKNGDDPLQMGLKFCDLLYRSIDVCAVFQQVV